MSGMTFGTGGRSADVPGGGLGVTDDNAPMGEPPEQTDEQRRIVKMAKKFYEHGMTWESTWRSRFVDDLKFDAADAYNSYQWPNSVRRLRDIDDRPCLTINKTRQHNLQIINDCKQNKYEVKIRGTNGEASAEAAECYENLIRHILYKSKFSTILDQAAGFQIRGGMGVLRVVTDFEGDDTLDQEAYVRPVIDPLLVIFDPDAKLADKSDGRMAMIFDNIPKDDWEEMYPEYRHFRPGRDIGGLSNLDDGWITKEHIRICEFFYKVPKTKRVMRFTDPISGQMVTASEGEIPKEILATVVDNPATQHRTVTLNEVRHCVIVGDCVVEENIWPGRYIPLIPVLGEESVIDGIMDRKGHTRALIDPQRMYNYWASAAVEFGALQTKSPWIGSAAAIEGHEQSWNTANKQNKAVLLFNHMDDEGNELAPPQRPPAPEQAPLYIAGMQQTATEMMMVSGQYQNSMGEQGNERTGKAIQERQRQGENATYHFVDNQAIAVRHLGVILVDLIPKIMTAPRVTQILGQDGKTSIPCHIDPAATQAYQQELGQDQQVISRVFNPNVGKYDVMSDIGPAYATRRDEAFNAMTQILTQAPQLTSIIGDIMLKNADFPGAEESARRLERMVPPQAKGIGPDPAMAQAQEQIKALSTEMQKMALQLSKAELRLAGKEQMRDIDSYKAETGRLEAFLGAGVFEPEGFARMLKQLISDAMETHIGRLAQQTAGEATSQFGTIGGQAQGAMPQLPQTPAQGNNS